MIDGFAAEFQGNTGDHQLVVEARTGSAAAFRTLVNRHQTAITGYLYRLTGDREAAADLTQETFLVAFRKLWLVSEDRSFSAWLHGIALNEARTFERRQKLLRFVSLEPIVNRVSVWVGHAGEDRLDAVHERELIQATLDRLPARQREALLLHSLAGFSVEEIAVILDSSVAATRKLVTRSRQEFRLRYHELTHGEHSFSNDSEARDD